MKSYKICSLDNLNTSEIQQESPYNFGDYLPFKKKEDAPPDTSIMLAKDSIGFKDFIKYKIEHEVEENVLGRILGGASFDKIIRKGLIDGIVNQKLNLLLLVGKKRVVLDFCKINKKRDSFRFNTTSINMKKLLVLLPNIKLAWFSIDKGLITSSALVGHNIENTPNFKAFQKIGDISTLTFHFLWQNIHHPILLTSDGTVVLQSTYKTIEDEISLILSIKEKLLDGVMIEDSTD